MDNDSRQLLKDIERGAKALGMTPGYLCKLAVKNGHLPKRIKKGVSPRLNTASKVRSYIARRMKELRP